MFVGRLISRYKKDLVYDVELAVRGGFACG